jgi:hypothetical protein
VNSSKELLVRSKEGISNTANVAPPILQTIPTNKLQINDKGLITAPYAFMKTSQPPPPPPQQQQLKSKIIESGDNNELKHSVPKFLISSQTAGGSFYKDIPSKDFNNTNQLNKNESLIKPIFMMGDNNNLKSPNSSPTQLLPNEIIDEPKVYSIENRLPKFMKQRMQYPEPAALTAIRSVASSPPESVCSRMSDTSIPSVIGQDISNRSQLFNKFLSINRQQQQEQGNTQFANPIIQTTAPQQKDTKDTAFKAIFTKLNINSKTQNPENKISKIQEEHPLLFHSTSKINFLICSFLFSLNVFINLKMNKQLISAKRPSFQIKLQIIYTIRVN